MFDGDQDNHGFTEDELKFLRSFLNGNASLFQDCSMPDQAGALKKLYRFVDCLNYVAFDLARAANTLKLLSTQLYNPAVVMEEQLRKILNEDKG